MPSVNPCCMPLQKGVKIMATINIVLDCISVVTIILAILAVTVWKDEIKDRINNDYDIALGTLIVSLIIAILGLLLSIRLYVGANNRDIRNCKIWLIVTLILTILDLITYIVNASAGSTYTTNLVFSVIGLLYTVYMMWVVYAFIQEMKSDNSRLGFQARFEEGATAYPMQAYPSPYVQQPSSNGVVIAVHQPHQNYPPPPPNQQYIYNQNNQYATSGNI